MHCMQFHTYSTVGVALTVSKILHHSLVLSQCGSCHEVVLVAVRSMLLRQSRLKTFPCSHLLAAQVSAMLRVPLAGPVALPTDPTLLPHKEHFKDIRFRRCRGRPAQQAAAGYNLLGNTGSLECGSWFHWHCFTTSHVISASAAPLRF